LTVRDYNDIIEIEKEKYRFKKAKIQQK